MSLQRHYKASETASSTKVVIPTLLKSFTSSYVFEFVFRTFSVTTRLFSQLKQFNNDLIMIQIQ